MADKRYALDRDLKEAVAMAKALDSYVKQDQLYASTGGGFFSSMPAMTIGGLLMRLRRLDVLRDKLSVKQSAELKQAVQQHQVVRKEWREHYKQKMLYEANSRLDAMRTFFDECSTAPQTCAQIYGPEASRRTIVQELMMALDELDIGSEEIVNKARATDSRLHRVLQPADSFIWSGELEPAYPQDVFWWLYQRPPSSKN
jgi:hypothetical protein